MYCASSKRVTNFSEKNVFNWNDLVMAAKSFNECTLNHFWQIFSFLKNFGWEQTVASYHRSFCRNWLKWTVPALKRWQVSERKFSLHERIYYLLWKVPKSASPTVFDKFSVFSGTFSMGQTFASYDWSFFANYLKWTVPLLKRQPMP